MATPVPTQAPTTTATPVVNFITGNKNKLSEVKAILEPTIQVNSQALDLIEVQGTLEEVTLAKCRTAAEQVSRLFSSFVVLFLCVYIFVCVCVWWNDLD